MRYEDKVRIRHIIEEAKNTIVMTAKLECFPLRTHALRQDTQKDKIKRKFLDQWVKGVNQHR